MPFVIALCTGCCCTAVEDEQCRRGSLAHRLTPSRRTVLHPAADETGTSMCRLVNPDDGPNPVQARMCGGCRSRSAVMFFVFPARPGAVMAHEHIVDAQQYLKHKAIGVLNKSAAPGVVAALTQPIVAIATRRARGGGHSAGFGAGPLRPVATLLGRRSRPRRDAVRHRRERHAIDQGLAIHSRAAFVHGEGPGSNSRPHGGPVVCSAARALPRSRRPRCAWRGRGGVHRARVLNDKIDLAQDEAVRTDRGAHRSRARSAGRSLSGAFRSRSAVLRDKNHPRCEWRGPRSIFPKRRSTFSKANARGLRGRHAELEEVLDRAANKARCCARHQRRPRGQPNVGKSSLMNALAGAELDDRHADRGRRAESREHDPDRGRAVH